MALVLTALTLFFGAAVVFHKLAPTYKRIDREKCFSHGLPVTGTTATLQRWTGVMCDVCFLS